jgi:nitrogen fixation/metabolism regulation signal transduction histidine kinase
MLRARRLPRLQFNAVFDENAARLQNELRSLRALVARFGDFSRAPEPRLETTDLRELMRGVVSALAPLLDERGLDLGTSIAAQPLPILGDPAMLFSALYSLVLIAADEAPHQSLITVSAAHIEERAHISILCRDSALPGESAPHRYSSLAAGLRHEADLGLATIRAVLAGHRGSLAVQRPENTADFHFRYAVEIPLANMLLSAPQNETGPQLLNTRGQ